MTVSASGGAGRPGTHTWGQRGTSAGAEQESDPVVLMVFRRKLEVPRAGAGDPLGDDSVLKTEPTSFVGGSGVGREEEKKGLSRSPRCRTRGRERWPGRPLRARWNASLIKQGTWAVGRWRRECAVQETSPGGGGPHVGGHPRRSGAGNQTPDEVADTLRGVR